MNGAGYAIAPQQFQAWGSYMIGSLRVSTYTQIALTPARPHAPQLGRYSTGTSSYRDDSYKGTAFVRAFRQPPLQRPLAPHLPSQTRTLCSRLRQLSPCSLCWCWRIRRATAATLRRRTPPAHLARHRPRRRRRPPRQAPQVKLTFVMPFHFACIKYLTWHGHLDRCRCRRQLRLQPLECHRRQRHPGHILLPQVSVHLGCRCLAMEPDWVAAVALPTPLLRATSATHASRCKRPMATLVALTPACSRVLSSH